MKPEIKDDIINELQMLARKYFDLSLKSKTKSEKEELKQISIIIEVTAKAILNNRHQGLISPDKLAEIIAL